MKNSIPIVETDAAPEETIYLLPRVHPVVYVPPDGFSSFEQQLGAEQAALLEAYTQAARRGEVGVIKFGKREGK